MSERSAYLKELNRIGNRYSPVIGTIIQKDYENAAKNLERGEYYDLKNIISPKPYHKALIRLVVEVGIDKALREHNRLVRQKRSLDDILYEWASFLARYAQMNLATQVTRISQTTEAELQKIIEKGLLNGDGYAVIARNIRRESTSDFNNYRSLLIARTEGANASNRGAYLAAKSSGLIMTKQWLHAGHAKKENRPAHVALGQQRGIDIDQPFWVNGKFMLHPGDPAGGAEENCNCRCCAVYRPKRTADGELMNYLPQRPSLIQRAMAAAIAEEVLRMIFVNTFGDE